MDEEEWLTSCDSRPLLRYLRDPKYWPKQNNRQKRLFHCAVCRLAWGMILAEPKIMQQTVEFAEIFAEGKTRGTDSFAIDSLMDEDHNPHLNYLVLQTVKQDVWERNLIYAKAKRCNIPDCDLADTIREIFGNPFRGRKRLLCDQCKGAGGQWGSGGGILTYGTWVECRSCDGYGRTPEGKWMTREIHRIARGAYEERLEDGRLDPARLAVLSDAAEEAGCMDEDLLGHLRGKEGCGHCHGAGTVEVPSGWKPCIHCVNGIREIKHWRGCWALDAFLGME